MTTASTNRKRTTFKSIRLVMMPPLAHRASPPTRGFAQHSFFMLSPWIAQSVSYQRFVWFFRFNREVRHGECHASLETRNSGGRNCQPLPRTSKLIGSIVDFLLVHFIHEIGSFSYRGARLLACLPMPSSLAYDTGSKASSS